jgi:hypothetical protein
VWNKKYVLILDSMCTPKYLSNKSHGKQRDSQEMNEYSKWQILGGSSQICVNSGKERPKLWLEVFYQEYSQFKDMYLWKTIPSKTINVTKWQNIYLKNKNQNNLKNKLVRLSQYSNRLQIGQLGFTAQQGQDFSLLHSIQTGCWAHPASYPMGPEGEFPRGKTTRAWS